jgi:ATP-binding protein involved in chromosome partitioning
MSELRPDDPRPDDPRPDDPRPDELLEDLAVVRARVDTQLDGVRCVIAIMSGKGGVGKSAVAVNLAVALARRGQRTALLDADVNSPSLAKMLGLRGRPVRLQGEELLPTPAAEGLVLQSMDFFLQGGRALGWDGREGEGAHLRSMLEDAALADLLGRTRWGDCDFLVVDLAPGADRIPALARVTGRIDGAIAVTIPTEVALLAVERSVHRAREARVPLMGLVENMGTAVCPHCHEEHALYREAPVERAAADLGLPLLARVPFDPALAAAGDHGEVFDAAGGSPAGAAFATLAEHALAYEPPGPEGDSW